jgi:hypothetical protein
MHGLTLSNPVPMEMVPLWRASTRLQINQDAFLPRTGSVLDAGVSIVSVPFQLGVRGERPISLAPPCQNFFSGIQRRVEGQTRQKRLGTLIRGSVTNQSNIRYQTLKTGIAELAFPQAANVSS